MTACREWFSSQELAGMPGMPTTDRRVRSYMEKNLAASRPKGCGKGLEYSRDSLPDQTQEYLAQQDLQEVLQSLPAPAGSAGQAGASKTPAAPAGQTLPAVRQASTLALPQPVSPPDSTSAQRERDLARRLVLRTLRDLQAVSGASTRAAAQQLLDHARSGLITPAMVAKLRQACDERGLRAADGDDGFPSVVTLCRWARTQAAGHSLAPRPSAVPDLVVRGWYRPFFALCDRPQKPTLKWAHEQLLSAWRPEWADPPGSPPPSYDQAAYAYNKRSKIDRLKGRHTGSALRSKMFFHKRTYHGMAPGTEVHSDGWTTHFTAPDPKTGAFVTYEVWHYHDVATRYVPPMAVGMTENTDVILQGLERCIRVLGVPCIWQTDHTSSVKNARVLDEHAGLADRLGLTVVHPQTVGNSQANGIAENFNTWLDRESRELATYQHPERMDSATFVRVRRITNAMVRAADKPAERAMLRAQAMKMGKGLVFDSYDEAVAWLDERTQRWNNHPHRELPKVRDEATGRMVHMTPAQSLAAATAAGWEPVALTAAELEEEFRPHLRKKVTRGTVTPYGGMRYHHTELAHHEGEEVLVAVDRHNPDAVRVKDLQGRLIAEAKFVAAVGPRTESMAEHTDRKRAEAQIRRREQQIEQIEERLAPAALEMGEQPLQFPDPATFVVEREAVPVPAAAEAAADPHLAAVLALPPRRTERQRDYLDDMAELLDALAAQQQAEEGNHTAADPQQRAAGGGG